VQPDTDALAAFLGGFVAAEGCFSGTAKGNRFILEVSLGASDRAMCEIVADFLGVGHIYDSSRRQAHYDDEAAYQIQSLRDLVEVVVPFMDDHLPRLQAGAVLGMAATIARLLGASGQAGAAVHCGGLREAAAGTWALPQAPL